MQQYKYDFIFGNLAYNSRKSAEQCAHNQLSELSGLLGGISDEYANLLKVLSYLDCHLSCKWRRPHQAGGGINSPKPYAALDVWVDFRFEFWGIEGDMLRKRYSNRYAGLFLFDFCTIFRLGAVGNGPGPNVCREPAPNRPKLNYRF